MLSRSEGALADAEQGMHEEARKYDILKRAFDDLKYDSDELRHVVNGKL